MFLPTLGDGSISRIDDAPSNKRFRRLANFGLGLLFFGAAIAILVWNEASIVGALRDSGRVAKAVAEVSDAGIDPSQDGRLVHVTGILVTKQLLSDPAMGVSEAGLVRLRRTVEMFQWRESRQANSSDQIGASDAARAIYSYAKKWSEAPIDSTRFNAPLHHENPPMPMRTELVTARDAAIGDRVLAPSLVATLDAFEPLAPPSPAPTGFARTADGLYKGAKAEAPEIGDIRVTFAGVFAQSVSVVAEQQGASLVPARTASGKGVAQVVPGHVSATALVAQRRDGFVRAWLLRAVGFALLVLAVMLVSRSSSPAAGARAGLPALCAAAALTMVIVGLAWIAFRPLLGTLLIAGAALVVLSYRRLRPASPQGPRASHTAVPAA